jgi:hypothetical protein
MAYLLYRHLKQKRAGAGKAPKAPKSAKLCEHRRDVTLNNLSDFSTTPLPVDPNQKDSGNSEKALTAPDTPCVLCKEEKRAARKYRWKLIAGLFFPFCVQALDTTIVAGALPFIASDFSNSSHLSQYMHTNIM